MTQDYLIALIDISKKLKLQPNYSVDKIRNSGLLRSPRRRPSCNDLLEEVTEYAMRRRPSKDNLLVEGFDTTLKLRKVSSHTCFLADVRECEEDGTCTKDDGNDVDIMSLTEKLNYVIKTLNEIREQDQSLSRQFLHIYAEIKRTKVRQSCMMHQDMLDEVFNEETNQVHSPHVCDAPVNKRSSKALKQWGITRMNIKSKRFSCS